jgi:hypothetical protein
MSQTHEVRRCNSREHYFDFFHVYQYLPKIYFIPVRGLIERLGFSIETNFF